MRSKNLSGLFGGLLDQEAPSWDGLVRIGWMPNSSSIQWWWVRWRQRRLPKATPSSAAMRKVMAWMEVPRRTGDQPRRTGVRPPLASRWNHCPMTDAVQRPWIRSISGGRRGGAAIIELEARVLVRGHPGRRHRGAGQPRGRGHRPRGHRPPAGTAYHRVHGHRIRHGERHPGHLRLSICRPRAAHGLRRPGRGQRQGRRSEPARPRRGRQGSPDQRTLRVQPTFNSPSSGTPDRPDIR